MSDIARIEENLKKIIDSRNPEARSYAEDYLKQEGYTLESWRKAVDSSRVVTEKMRRNSSTREENYDYARKERVEGLQRLPANIDAAMRRAANSATFGLADKASAGINSFVGSILPEPMRKLIGMPGGSYTDQLRGERQKSAQAAQTLGPVGTFAADAAGGLALGGVAVKAGLSPLAAYGPRFGPVGKTVLGTVEGGAYGALTGAGNTDTGVPADYVENAVKHGAEGALFGGGATGLLEVAKAGYRALPGNKEFLTRKAQEILARAKAWDKGYVNKNSGPDMMLADTGPGMRGVAQGVATRPGAGATEMITALQERQAGRHGRLQTAADDTLGPAGTTSLSPGDQNQASAFLRDKRKGLGPEYQEVWDNAPKLDITDVINTIDGRLKTAKGPVKAALLHARSMLVKSDMGVKVMDSNTGQIITVAKDQLQPHHVPVARNIGGPLKPIPEDSAEAINQAKIALSNLVQHGDPGVGVAPGAISRSEGDVKLVISLINDRLRTGVPGYSAVTDKSAELARRLEGVQTGFEMIGGGPQNATPPRVVAEAVGMDAGRGANAVRVGGRARVDAEIGNNPNDLRALNKIFGGEGDWNRAKMEMVFGKESTDRLLSAVQQEGRFANTENAITGGSQTGQRVGASQAIDDGVSSGSLLPFSSLTGALNWAGGKLLGAASSKARDGVRDELGRALSLKGQALDDFLAKAELLAKEREFAARTQAAATAGLLGGEQGISQPSGLMVDINR